MECGGNQYSNPHKPREPSMKDLPASKDKNTTLQRQKESNGTNANGGWERGKGRVSERECDYFEVDVPASEEDEALRPWALEMLIAWLVRSLSDGGSEEHEK